MAKTYTALASTVLSGSTTTVSFTSIPGSYTDLIVRISGRVSTAGVNFDNPTIKINTVTTNRSGTNASFSSSTASSTSVGTGGIALPAALATSNTFGAVELRIPNYANTSYNKPFWITSVSESNGSGTNYGQIVAGLWASTAAITQLDFDMTPNNFVTGSRFDLFGVTHF